MSCSPTGRMSPVTVTWDEPNPQTSGMRGGPFAGAGGKLHLGRCQPGVLLSPRSSCPSLSPSALSVLLKSHLCLKAVVSPVLFLPFPLSDRSS